MPAADTSLVDIDALRLGMVVHLELSWLEHPFPRNRFELTSEEQIGVLRGLGLKQVRIQVPVPAVAAAEPGPSAGTRTADEPGTAPADEDAAATRARLDAERRSLRRCEEQFARTALGWTEVCRQVLAHPSEAMQRSQALVAELMADLAGPEPAHVRLLGESAGDLAGQHSVNVTVLSLMLAASLGFAGTDLEAIGLGALLHDLGKIELPPSVRHEDPRHGAQQQQLYRDHVAHGVRLGVRMGLAPEVLRIIAQHHERADGTGFPKQIELERIDQAARIVALINQYDVLCNPAQPTQAMTPHEALTHLDAQQRGCFDPNIVNGLVRLLGVYPPGSVIQLTDSRYAIVAAVNPEAPLRPMVLVHEPSVRRDDAMLTDLRSTRALGIRRSLHAHQLPRAALEYLSPRERTCYFFERHVGGDSAEVAA